MCTFYSEAALLAMQSVVIPAAIPTVRPSLRPSHAGTLSDEWRIMRSSLWGSENTLVFWYQQWFRGDVPFDLKFDPKVTHPSEKRRLWPIFAYNVLTVRVSEKVWRSRSPGVWILARNWSQNFEGDSDSSYLLLYVDKNNFLSKSKSCCCRFLVNLIYE